MHSTLHKQTIVGLWDYNPRSADFNHRCYTDWATRPDESRSLHRVACEADAEKLANAKRDHICIALLHHKIQDESQISFFEILKHK